MQATLGQMYRMVDSSIDVYTLQVMTGTGPGILRQVFHRLGNIPGMFKNVFSIAVALFNVGFIQQCLGSRYKNIQGIINLVADTANQGTDCIHFFCLNELVEHAFFFLLSGV